MTEENMSEPARAEAQSDAEFAARLLSSLPGAAVSPALEARILADFDRVAANKRRGAWIAGLTRGLRDAVWPGAPAWQPAAVFALSLIAGLAAGVFVPSSDVLPGHSAQSQAIGYDTAPALDLAKDL
ncbi:MAG: hypothetical protein KGJ79_10725 [Alphaproteobacteria bacterium]|nr:hypothetical protein [Alphaproteobacteria bacterium]MDE2495723.1 hypothetical protein [Alphaproteobacteria bacterium]